MLKNSSYSTTAKKWSKPENLGPAINSNADEVTPFIQGSNLYFSSNRFDGLGAMDIYRAIGRNGQWNEAINFGVSIITQKPKITNVVVSSNKEFTQVFRAGDKLSFIVDFDSSVEVSFRPKLVSACI